MFSSASTSTFNLVTASMLKSFDNRTCGIWLKAHIQVARINYSVMILCFCTRFHELGQCVTGNVLIQYIVCHDAMSKALAVAFSQFECHLLVVHLLQFSVNVLGLEYLIEHLCEFT